jgi:ubiquinone/menaquinone biosynthesis C-methylase UbiE
MCHVHQIQPEAQDAFAERLLDTINASASALMISIGHRTGLFDALAGLPPSAPEAIAQAAGLNERYVREWLGAMACARVIEVDDAGERYWLPAEHAPMLTRNGGADNMAPFTQYIAVLGGVEGDIVSCFQQGGGVPYERFERFHDVMAEDSGQSVLSVLFDAILPLVPGVHDELERGIEVLDLGCGRGRALLSLAERYPNSRFVGYDLCAEPLEQARAEAAALGLNNVTFEERDAQHIDDAERFALITTFDAIHDQARPDVVLRNIHRALAPSGRYLMQDIDAASNPVDNLSHPMGPLLYTISTMHCMTVSLAQGGLGLGTMWGRETAREMLRQAGFSEPAEHMLPHDPQNRYYVLQK